MNTVPIRDWKLKHAWLLGGLVVLYVAWRQPLALEPMLVNLAQVWFGAVVGYWIDKTLYDYAVPDGHEPNADWMLRRTVIVAACILGVALG